MKNFSKWVESKKGDKIVVIMRGIPGTGKSYTAKEMLEKYGGGNPHDHIFSTDDYFTTDIRNEKLAKQVGGEEIDHDYYDQLEKETYRANWAPHKLGPAHSWNYDRFKQAAEQGVSPLIVDNTNVKSRDFKRYTDLAKKLRYKVVIQEPTSEWWRDHAHMFKDKQKHGKQLEDFARFLAGHHQGMEQKYGVGGNVHGVPVEVIRNMIRKWQPNLKPE